MNGFPRTNDSRMRGRGWRLLVCALLLGATVPVYAAGGILVFGDSLSAAYGIDRSAGWVALLRERLAAADASLAVHNASVSGETTAGGRERLPEALARTEPDIVVLELGANDGLRALSLEAMQANLAAMIEASREAGAEVLLLGMRIPTNYGRDYGERFHASFETLAERHDVAYVPFFLAPIARDRSAFQDDGVHPDAAAQPALLEHVWPALEPLVTKVRQTSAAR
ncbi:arylesterase [Salinisphaera orenii]|nr:arylesterase [Salinisphaera halophila]